MSALAHETRLAVFRLLVRAGPAGLPAGVVAERLAVPASTLSFHLKDLERAGLLRAARDSRRILYAVDFVAMRTLLDFLMEDCCQDHPELRACGCPDPATVTETQRESATREESQPPGSLRR